MLIARFNRFPPMLCRLLARTRHGTRPMTTVELSAASGLTRERVTQISGLPSWEHLPLRDIEAFSRACGVNLLAPHEQRKFLRRRKRAYLERAAAGQRKLLARLIRGMVARRDEG